MKVKTKKCPNCGQKTVINDIAVCQWCGWPLSARTSSSPTRLQSIFSRFLIVLAVFIMVFGLVVYKGIWKYIYSIPLNRMHDSLPWLICTFAVALVVLALSYVIGRQIVKIGKWETLTVFLVYPITSAAVLLYYIRTFAEKTGSQFELSIVSATIGGLVLVSGFIGEGKSASAKELIKVGKWFLIASVFGTMFALFMPALKGITNPHGTGYNLFFALTAATLIVATFSFAWAISLILPKLWRLGR